MEREQGSRPLCDPLKCKSIPNWLKWVWLPTFTQSDSDHRTHAIRVSPVTPTLFGNCEESLAHPAPKEGSTPVGEPSAPEVSSEWTEYPAAIPGETSALAGEPSTPVDVHELGEEAEDSEGGGTGGDEGRDFTSVDEFGLLLGEVC
ncbi:unnamed protein product [Phytophthora fragariaefolia]|uniref:Unnamed protein product n=1 Tax=Phytophthora fragariaefolia TaxID=1490495 RepID=A0A9W6TW76_9STRA|nr:unnamed protein product [Phytophthora fragariaefolia]